MNAQVHINILRFKGNDNQRQYFINALEQASWLMIDEREFLFIRSIAVAGDSEQLAGRVLDETVNARSKAVSGVQPGSSKQDVVVFSSHAELLACLSLALLRHEPAWYWSQWRALFTKTFAQALAELWTQNIKEIPAVTAHLAQQGKLSDFWSNLPETFTEQLCRLLLPGDLDKLVESKSGMNRAEVSVPVSWVRRWQPVFEKPNIHPRQRQLAALIILQEWQPMALQTPYDAAQYQAVLEVLQSMPQRALFETATLHPDDSLQVRPVAPTDQPLNRKSDPVDRRSVSTDARSPSINPLSQSKPLKAAKDKQAQSDKSTSADSALPESNLPATTQHAVHREKSLNPDRRVPKADAHPIRPEDGVMQATEQRLPKRIQVEQGGLFYLLNFLNLPSIQRQLINVREASGTLSGWVWLYGLGLKLGLKEEMTLQHLLIDLCGFDDMAELETMADIAAYDELLAIGRQRYSERLFNAELLNISAEVVVQDNHVDVFYPLNDVRIAVRRSGLDLDPGWLPWLGKVVTFHYQAIA